MSHQIDTFAYSNRLRELPPSHKLGFAIAMLVLALLSPPLIQGAIGLWLSVAIVCYAGIPGRFYCQLLALPIGFWLMSLPAFVINGVTLDKIASIRGDMWLERGISIGNFWLYISHTGLHQVSLLLPRAWAATTCMYFILLTIPVVEIVRILRRLGCPALLTELLYLMYRFIFTIWEIARELWIAQNARCGYRTYRRSFESLGILVGQLLQRTLINYRQVSLSLAARGFNGEFRVGYPRTYRPSRRYAIEAICGFTLLTILASR